MCIKNKTVNSIRVICCNRKNIVRRLWVEILKVILDSSVYSKLIVLYFMRNIMNAPNMNVGMIN